MKTKKHFKNINEIGEEENEYLEDEISNELMTQKDPKKTQKDPKKTQKDPKINTNEHKINSNELEKYKCDYCNSLFTSYAHKRRHEIHRCKENKDYKALYVRSEKEKEKLRREWEKEKDKLYKKIEKLIDRVGNTYNTTQNIILNSYGNENMNHITDSYKMRLLQRYAPLMMIPKLIRDIHFNDSFPENKNIIYPNKKENKIKVYKDDKWTYQDKDYIINDLIEDKYNVIEDHYMEHSDELSDMKKYKYDKFRVGYDNENKDVIQALHDECEMLLLNNR